MELRVLGTHNFESKDTRMCSYLIDGVLALDAGSLSRALTFDQQRHIRAILLSHRHFDHTFDLLPLGLVCRNSGVTVDVYGIDDTIDFVVSHLLDTRYYPDFTKIPSPDKPTYRFHVVEFHKEFKVLDYTAMAVPVRHSAPAAGFQVSSGGAKLFYTGDTGEGLSNIWRHVSPDVLLTEVTFGNGDDRAAEFGHLTPALLAEELAEFKAQRGYFPRVIASHFFPPSEEAVRTGLKEVASRLGIDIAVAEADQTLKLASLDGSGSKPA
jgi:ribonuclease BN (tRNA processing enzyme)